jgi:hypothetical protein
MGTATPVSRGYWLGIRLRVVGREADGLGRSYALRRVGGSGHAIFVVPDMQVVVVHRVDYDTWGSDWVGVYDLVLRILAARNPLREE